MEHRLQVLLFPLDLSHTHEEADKRDSRENDPNAEADVLVAAAAENRDLAHTPTRRPQQHLQRHVVEASMATIDLRESEAQRATAAAAPTPAADASLERRVDLASRLHYTVASYLCELERGRVLSRCTPRELNNHATAASGAMATGVATGDGQQVRVRHTYVYPVEDGRYVASLSVPPLVHHVFGSQIAPLILRTAIRGYDVASAVASSTAVPTYFPLHRRLREDPSAVQRALQARVAQIEQVSRLALTTGGTSPGDRERAALLSSLRRMCHQNAPCPLRASAGLGRALHRMIQAATQAVHPASLSGSVASVGVQAATKRFHVVAAAAWHNGEPLYYRSAAGGVSSSFVMEQHLTPSAVAVMLDAILLREQHKQRQRGEHREEPGRVQVQFKCIAMHTPTHNAETPSSSLLAGYVAPTMRAEEREHKAPSALALAFSNGGHHGWIISLLLTATPIPFAGTPLPYIISGMHELLTNQLLSSPMQSMLPSKSIGRVLGSAASAGLSSSFLKSLTVVARRTLAARDASALSASGGDTCLWHYDADAGRQEDEEKEYDDECVAETRKISCVKTQLTRFRANRSRSPSRADSPMLVGADTVAPPHRSGALVSAGQAAASRCPLEALLTLAGRLQSQRGRRLRRSQGYATTGHLLSLSHTVFSLLKTGPHTTILHATPSASGIVYVMLTLQADARMKAAEMAVLQREALRLSTWALSKCVEH